MNILNNAKYVSPQARRFMVFLALVVTITSTNVQAAEANDILPDAPAWTAEQSTNVDAEPNRSIVVPVASKELPKAQAAKKKKWNTVNAPDLTTPVEYSKEAAVRTITVPISAYNSEPGQTDSSPFTTADGSQVRDGIVAANFLKHGTRIRIPDHFGDKVFEVHDRMNARYTYKIDIWMLNKSDALKWGVRNVKVEILD
jgi:3D (Asp-Asp-Asp) domain-containing protein